MDGFPNERKRKLNPAHRGGLLEGDYKVKDIHLTGTDYLTVTVQTTLLNGIARGDDDGQRNAREIYMKDVGIQGYALNRIASPARTLGRILLVYDRQCNGAALTLAQLIGDAPPTHINTMFQYTLRENRRRFVVLKDWRVNIGVTGTFEAYSLIDWKVDLNLPVEYNSGDAGTVADITTGSLYLVSFGSGVANSASFDLYVRLRYFDK